MLITHCASCYIPHSNFSVFYVFQLKCWLFLFRLSYKKNQRRAFKILPEVTAFNICFPGRRSTQHHSAWGDCTNHKRRRMWQCLCCSWRHHWSYDLCWSSWWGQRCLPGNSVMIRIIIYTWTFRICYKHKRALFIISVKIVRNIIGPMSS